MKTNFDAKFLHFYMNDLFAMPLILAYANLLIDWSGIRSITLTTPFRIALLTLFCVIVWEGLTPMFLERSTRDILDVAAYLFGGLVYYLLVYVSRKHNTTADKATA